MSLADDKFIPTGIYAIINAEYDLSLAFSEQDQSLSASRGYEYGVRCAIPNLFKMYGNYFLV